MDGEVTKRELLIQLQIDFQEELDKFEEFKKNRHLDYDILASLYHLLLKERVLPIDDIPMLLYQRYGIRAPFDTGVPHISRRTVAKYITAIMDADDFHRSFKFDVNGYDGWYILYATDVEAALCKKRHISLLKFKVDIRPILDKFHRDAVVYYEHRKNMVRPPETMGDMKERYEALIRAEHGDDIKAAKYIRTEQDLVQLEFGDTRKAFKKEVYK